MSMLVRFTKNAPVDAADLLTCVRPDGSTTSDVMARQGILPHDAFHFVVESTLGWNEAFFGRVAGGASLAEVSAEQHDGPAGRPQLTQARQAEALIDCLQNTQWGGATAPAAFANDLAAACRRRRVLPPTVTPEDLGRVRVALREFGAAWRPLRAGASLERRFGP